MSATPDREEEKTPIYVWAFLVLLSPLLIVLAVPIGLVMALTGTEKDWRYWGR